VSDDLSIPSPTYRVPRHGRRGLDPALQRLMMYAGGLLAAGVVIGGVSMMFNRHSGPVPVVQPDSRPLRVKPENPGGMQIAGLNADGSADGDKAGKLAPPPEVPDPNSLKASGNSTTAAQTETATSRGAQPPVAVPRNVTPPPVAPTSQAQTTQAPTAQAQTAQAQTAPQQRAVAPAAPKPVQPTPAPLAHTPAAAAAPAPAASTAHAVGTPLPAAKPAPAGKGAAVQLAALSSEDAARTEWQHLEHRMPDVLGGKSPTFSKVEVGGRTYWRVRLSGFGDVAQAKAFCERVRAKSASCSVADF